MTANHRINVLDDVNDHGKRIKTLETHAAIPAAVVVCTSTTRPANPRPGTLIYETDTTKLGVWTGAAWLRALMT